MSDQSSQVSRRSVTAGGSTLLAGFGPGMALPVSGYADSGWRDAAGDPQRIAVDLRAPCEVASLRLVFGAAVSGPVLVPSPSSNPRDSGRPVGFVIETSRDHETWTTAYRTSAGAGGVVDIALERPVTARWVRLTAGRRSPVSPLGLNGFQVYGSWRTPRPPVTDCPYRAAVEARLGTATGPDDFARKAEFVDYESHRAMFEAGNSRLPDDPGGLTQWTSHPAWSSAAWGPHGHDGAFDVGGAYYGARKGGEPLHIQADPVSGQVIAVNRTTRPVTLGTVTAHYYDLDGRQLVPEQRKRVNIAPSATSAVFTADRMADHPPLHLLRLRMEDPLGRLLSENTYWRYRDAEDMRGLNTVRRTVVSADLGAPGEDGTRRTLTASVRNRGSAVAAMVRLSLLDGETGARVLPALSSDNYLWLLPGESRTVTLSWPSSALRAGHRPRLQVDGYNVPRAITR